MRIYRRLLLCADLTNGTPLRPSCPSVFSVPRTFPLNCSYLPILALLTLRLPIHPTPVTPITSHVVMIERWLGPTIPVLPSPFALNYPPFVSRRQTTYPLRCASPTRHQSLQSMRNPTIRMGALIPILLRPHVSPPNPSLRLPLARHWTLGNRE